MSPVVKPKHVHTLTKMVPSFSTDHALGNTDMHVKKVRSCYCGVKVIKRMCMHNYVCLDL